MPELFPCVITLTQEGQPAKNVGITLRGGVDSTWTAAGSTGEAGKAEIFTRGKYKGAPAGTYKVVLLKREQEPSKLGPAPPDTSPEYEAYQAKAEAEVRPTFTLVDPKYTRQNTTDLSVTVGPEQSTFTFEIGKTVRIKTQ